VKCCPTLSPGYPGSSYAGVFILEEGIRVSVEAGARGDSLERPEMQATKIVRPGSERNDIQARYDALETGLADRVVSGHGLE
jgi:hypothetical protein